MTELAMVPAVDMARVRRELAIDKRVDEVSEASARERGSLASADLGCEVKRMWAEAKADAAEDTEWFEFWASLGIDRQREIVRSMFKVPINLAKGIRRHPARDVERLKVARLG